MTERVSNSSLHALYTGVTTISSVTNTLACVLYAGTIDLSWSDSEVVEFIDVEFPFSGYGSKGGPMFKTDAYTVGSGHVIRANRWGRPLGRYDVSTGLQDQNNLTDVLQLFHVTEGPLKAFRYKDWADFNTSGLGYDDYSVADLTNSDVEIGTGDGVETEFQLIKEYSVPTHAGGTVTVQRNITLPRRNTVTIAVNGTAQTETTHYTVDYDTGLVTFVTAPTDTHSITAGFEFDAKCVFENESLETDQAMYAAGRARCILIEVP